jgi:hypothetical protein
MQKWFLLQNIKDASLNESYIRNGFFHNGERTYSAVGQVLAKISKFVMFYSTSVVHNIFGLQYKNFR